MSVQLPAVLLVPGWKDDASVLRPFARRLVELGWDPGHVLPISFRDPFGSNIDHAWEIAAAVDQLAAATGSDDIAIVAHSMGGLAVRRYLLDTPHPAVRTVVTLASPHAGTWLAWLARGDGGRDMRPGSPFLQGLAGLPLPSTVRFVCMQAPLDSRVVPADSVWIENAERHRLPAAGHKRILRHARVADFVAETLRPAAGRSPGGC